MRTKGTRAVLALAAIGAIGLVAPASAAPAVKTKVKLTEVTATGATGKLSSRQAKCEKRRKVALKFSGEYSSVRIATARTNRRGKFRISANVDDPGVYFVTTGPAKRGKVKCAGGQSNAERFNG